MPARKYSAYLTIGLLVVAACSDSPFESREPDLKGGWTATRSCQPTNCVQRFWASSPREIVGVRVEYDVADTVFHGNGTISEAKTGTMTIRDGFVLVIYAGGNSGRDSWSLFTEDPVAPNATEFVAFEQWRTLPAGQVVESGPWAFSRVP